MLATILFTLFLGITLGVLLLTISLLWIVKVKCPKCKKLKPLKEIIFFHWKTREITGQPCLKCQQVKPQIEIF